MKLGCALRVGASLPRLPRRPVLARFLSLKQERVKSDNGKKRNFFSPFDHGFLAALSDASR